MSNHFNRRNFIGLVSAGAAGMHFTAAAPTLSVSAGVDGKPALLGGEPVRTKPFPGWPVVEDNDRANQKAVLESKHWNRGSHVDQFEEAWASRLGAKYAVATSSGTSALVASLAALEVGPGDEVIVPPYTFVATINVVLLHHALPVFVDTDRSTFQIDPGKIASAITENTRCVMPVHLGGNVANMDEILKVARAKNVPVLEDACQSHLAEWRGQKVGTVGDLGCFSFQASKNLNSGEGGAATSNNGDLIARVASFQNAGRGYEIDENGKLIGDRSSGFVYTRNGDNRRLTEFQGALLLSQLDRLEEQAKIREQNAEYLTSLLKEVPGIRPAEMYEGCTRNAYHLYMFRFDPEGFAGMSRKRFLEAMKAEGVACSSGYGRLNKEPFLETTYKSRGFRRIYTEKEIQLLLERNECPENDRLCDEAVWLIQTQLLGPRSDMDEIAAAVRKIQKHAASLV
ncbi:MAG: DegT/DnrJ/EryC1/StrS family aminotransferase [Acidobacteriota bacterium]|nr:MAG: DegT/DnrJ/EryC1/StrS family aminotransferase [Acidobacteriota bacterium]